MKNCAQKISTCRNFIASMHASAFTAVIKAMRRVLTKWKQFGPKNPAPGY